MWRTPNTRDRTARLAASCALRSTPRSTRRRLVPAALQARSPGPGASLAAGLGYLLKGDTSQAVAAERHGGVGAGQLGESLEAAAPSQGRSYALGARRTTCSSGGWRAQWRRRRRARGCGAGAYWPCWPISAASSRACACGERSRSRSSTAASTRTARAASSSAACGAGCAAARAMPRA